MIHELQEHSKIHRYFSCEICFAGFVSDVILIELKIHDHPEGPSQPQTTPEESIPSTSGATGPQPLIIHVPDTDSFEEKLDLRIGLVNPDRNHQVKCEDCGRFLKSKKIRKSHVMCYHPMTAYQCPFDPNLIFYTKDDLVLHCKQNHIVCKLCDTLLTKLLLKTISGEDIPNHHHQRCNQEPPAAQFQ